MFQTFVEWLTQVTNDTNLFCGFIVFVALVSFVLMDILLLWHMHFSMRRIAYHASKLLSSGTYTIQNMNDVIAKSSSRIIKSLWKSYIVALNRSKQLISEQGVDITQYFNRTNVIEIPGKRRISEAIPGILTALGILGTFVGLVAGLQNINISDTDSIKSSLGALMQGLYVAFYTSVYGVLLSITWTLLDRGLMEVHINTLKKFVYNHHQGFPTYDTHDFLKDLLSLQKEQTEAIKHMGTDFALQFERSMDEQLIPAFNQTMSNTLEKVISPAFADLKNTVTKFSDYATDVQKEGLEQVINSFINGMNQSLQGQFENLSNTIQQTCEWQMQIKEDLDQLINEIEDATRNQKEINVSAEEIISQFTQHIIKLYDANEKIMDSINDMGVIADRVAHQTENNASLVDTISRLQEEAYQKTSTYIVQMKNQISSMGGNWERTETSLKLLNENLTHSMKEFSDKTHEGLKQTFGIFDRELANISTHLSGTIAEIKETMDEVPRIISEMKKDIILFSEASVNKIAAATSDTTPEGLNK